MSDYTENKTPNLIINTLEDPSKLSEITVGENEIVLVPDDTEEEIAKKQDKLVAGTNITLVDDPLTQTTLISSTASESFYKGTYENWSSVPTNGNAYPDTPRGSGNHKPTYTDYIIIQDASTVPGGQVDMSMTMETDTYAQYPNKKLETVIDSNTYNGTGTFYDGNIQVYCDAAGGNYSVHWKTLKSPVEYQGQTYQPGSDFLTLIIKSSNNGTRNAQLSLGNPYEGTWRFSYDGVWDTDNRNGWKGEYKVEDTLPDATPTVKGIAKLYNTTGTNTDGAVDQNTVTTELGKKQDTLTAGTNITIENNPDTGKLTINSVGLEAFFRGRFTNWLNTPTDTDLYNVDYHGNRVPTENDFMVLEDASDYVGVGPNLFVKSDITYYLNKEVGGSFSLPDAVGKMCIDLPLAEIKGHYCAFELLTDENFAITHSNYIIPGLRTGYDTFNIQNGNYAISNYAIPENFGGLRIQLTKRDGTEVTEEDWESIHCKLYIVTNTGDYQGSWRFAYHGTWSEDTKNGWKPEYQIENVLPVASDTTAGITKLYTETGQNTDGTMDQKSITDAINRIQDSCFRGSWNTWNDVPVSANLYPEDYKYSHTPTYNDYMVVNDASGYVPSDLLTVELIVIEMTNNICRYTIGADSYTKTRQSGQNAPFGPNNEMSWNTQGEGTQGTRITFNDQVKFRDHVYNAGEGITLENESGGYAVKDVPLSFFIKRNVETLTGAWRFSYQGVWETDGKSGWIEEYQIENTLPIATDTVAGIAKLYTTTGSNTDGSMDQNSITTALGTKQDILTAGNNITIDANNKIDAADKTLVSFVIWEDEE